MGPEPEISIAGSPAYICTVAGGGLDGTKFARADLFIDPQRKSAWSGACEVTCSSAAEDCVPEVFWVPAEHAAGQWLQCSLETPACIVGLRIEHNDGSKGAVGVGFHTTQFSVQVQLVDGPDDLWWPARKQTCSKCQQKFVSRSQLFKHLASTPCGRTPSSAAESPAAEPPDHNPSMWCNAPLADPSARLPPNGGSAMFQTAAFVRAVRILPTAWGDSGIGMHVVLLEELVAGPHDARFGFTPPNQGVTLDQDARKLIVCDNATGQEGGITNFRVTCDTPAAVMLQSLHVPRPQIWNQVVIRRVGFGSHPTTVFAISDVKIFEAAVGGIKVLAGGGAGYNNATGEAAGFCNLKDLCVTDASIYVADENMIRCCTFAGVVTTFAGTVSAGHVDAAGQAAQFNNINGLSYDEHAAALVCADTSNHRIRKICMMSAKATTIAGSGIAALKNGLGTAAAFHSPYGVAAWKRWIFVADSNNHALRVIAPDGLVTTLAGGRTAGYRDGCGPKALLNSPECICHDNQGRFYFIDRGNQRIRSFVANVTDVIPPAPSDLPRVLASLCDEEKGSGNDVIFNVAGKQVFAVRSLIQARSAYFTALLGGSKTRMLASDEEKQQARSARFDPEVPFKVDIADASYLAFRCVMQYLHSDLVEFPKEEGGEASAAVALEVLQLACKYQLPRLQVECERLISKSITSSNACSLLAAADRCNRAPPAGDNSRSHVTNLRSLAKAFVVRNFGQVRGSSDFARLPQHLLVEIALQLTVQG